MSSELSADEGARAELLAALKELRQQVYANYPAEALRPADQTSEPQGPASDHWWEVQEHPITSSKPLVGPLIAWVRSLWNSVSTKWFVRAIRLQQNEVNRIVTRRLEFHDRILRDLDHDQTRLTRQLAEALYRLDRIESRLMALGQPQEPGQKR